MNYDQDKAQKVSLQEFLKEKGTLLSSIGAMTGLAGVLGTIPTTLSKPFYLWPIVLVSIFSLLMMLGAMIMWAELNSKYPKNPEIRLRLFKYIFIAAYWLVVLFLLLLYRVLSNILLNAGLVVMVGLPLVRWITGLKRIRKDILKIRHEKLGVFRLVLCAAVVAGIIVYSLNMAADYINMALDYVSKIQVK